MPHSISAIRLLHFPTTTVHLSHNLHPCSPLITLPLALTTVRRRPDLRLFLVRCQDQSAAVELQAAEKNQNVAEEGDESASNTKVLIQNVPWTCVADDLRPLIEKHGTVVDIELSMYNKTRNRGLAFVTMASHDEARALLENLDNTEFEGRVLKLDWANPRPEKASPALPQPKPVHNIFVANLPFQARAKDLKDFFNSENANAVSAEVIFDPNRRATGYGFLSFNTKAEAEAAIAAFNGREFMGRPIRVARSKRFLRKETKASIESETQERKASIESEAQSASVV